MSLGQLVNWGTKELTFEWQPITNRATTREAYVLTQSWGGQKPYGKIIGRQVLFDNDESANNAGHILGTFALYPYDEGPQVRQLEIPQNLKDKGFVRQRLDFKMSDRTRIFQFDWTLRVQLFEETST